MPGLPPCSAVIMADVKNMGDISFGLPVDIGANEMPIRRKPLK